MKEQRFAEIFDKPAAAVIIQGDLLYGHTNRLQIQMYEHRGEKPVLLQPDEWWWTNTKVLEEEASKRGWVLKYPPIKKAGLHYRYIYHHPADETEAQPASYSPHTEYRERKQREAAIEQVARQVEGEAPITSFSGSWIALSNFALSPVQLDGVTYDCVEKAYQAAKTTDPKQREAIRMAQTAGQAKRMGAKLTLRPDWEAQKGYIMGALLRQKFAAGSAMANQLLRTGAAVLIEGNNWHDNYWGSCNCDACRRKHPNGGQNVLGRLLMKIRSELTTKH